MPDWAATLQVPKSMSVPLVSSRVPSGVPSDAESQVHTRVGVGELTSGMVPTSTMAGARPAGAETRSVIGASKQRTQYTRPLWSTIANRDVDDSP